MKKLSIIVPVYKVEAYISKCLDSLLEQDLPHDAYEIICINDGSPDKSVEIVRDYAVKNRNIILIEQKNQGVSMARNKGLDNASGEYIFFVDADDKIHPNCLSSLYNYASGNDLDLLYVRTEFVDEAGNVTGEIEMEDPTAAISDGFTHQRRGFISGLYKRETIGNVRFAAGIPIGEDALFNIMIHVKSKRIGYCDIPAYKYLMRGDSASKSAARNSDSVFLGYLKTIDILKIFLETNKIHYNQQQIDYFNRPFLKVSENALKTSIIPILSKSRFIALKEAISKNGLGYLNDGIEKRVKYYNKPWLIFMAYYGLKRITPILRFRR